MAGYGPAKSNLAQSCFPNDGFQLSAFNDYGFVILAYDMWWTAFFAQNGVALQSSYSD